MNKSWKDYKVTKVPQIQRNLFLFVLIVYILFTTLITIYDFLEYLVRYFWEFRFALVLTETGVSIITPLLPLTRILLAILGVVGAIYLFLRKKSGLWVSLCWSLLQIPSLTIWFGKPTKEIMCGMGALNLQYIHMGTFTCLASHSYTSAFTHTKSTLVTCYGVNFVGIVISFMLLVVWLQNNEYASNYLKNSGVSIVKRLISICQGALFIALLTIIASNIINNKSNRPNIIVDNISITCPIDIFFHSNDYSINTVMTNVNVTLKNKGKSPTTISQAYLKLQILPQTWMADLPIQNIYYPGGSNQGRIAEFSQPKLWPLIPDEFRKDEFKPFRLESEDQTTKKLSFVIPLQDIVRNMDGDPDSSFLIKGVVVVETVGGDIFQSKEIVTNHFRINRIDNPKINIPLGKHSDYIVLNEVVVLE